MLWLLALFGLPLLMLVSGFVVWAARSAGASWAFRIGFPVAEFWRTGSVSNLADGRADVDRLGPGAALCRLPGGLFFRGATGVLGLAEQTPAGVRLRFYSDGNATVAWGAWIFLAAIMLIVPLVAPNMSWGEAVLSLAVGVALLLPLAYSVRRAHRRAGAFAERAGFDYDRSNSGAV
jgi:hypothetical protein